MLAGRQVINLDNCNRPLRGADLCNLLTAERVCVADPRAVKDAGDHIWRSFILAKRKQHAPRRRHGAPDRHEPHRPEDASVPRNGKIDSGCRGLKLEVAVGRYVSACLTIICRLIELPARQKQNDAAGKLRDLEPERARRHRLGGTGRTHCANASKLREADPELERFLNIAQQWEKHFGNDWKKLAEGDQ